MRKHLPVFALCILLAVCMMPVSTFGAESDDYHGYRKVTIKPPQFTREQVQLNADEAAGLPAKLDPREEPWFKQNIRVRDQADTGLCWAFAATSAAQISYAKKVYEEAQGQSGEGDSEQSGTDPGQSGQPGTDPDQPAVTSPELSPVHLAYFLYNRVNDPLGNTPYDKDQIVDGTPWQDMGGNCFQSILHLATWSGAGAEADTPFVIETGEDGPYYAGPNTFDKSLAYSNALILDDAEAYFEFPDLETEKNIIKTMVGRYGAVDTGIFESSGYKKKTEDGELAHYNPKGNVNHEIAIIGWDDSFPASDFRVIQPGDRHPTQDGAWLALNSYGEEEPGKGYFWISYESVDVMEAGAAGYDMEQPDPDLSLYQYDGTVSTDYAKMYPTEIAANVYTAPADHQIQLDEVGLTNWDAGPSEYTLTIYAGLTDTAKPNSGLKQLTQQIRVDAPGYNTVDLVHPVTIDAGEKFTVALTCNDASVFGTESDYTEVDVYGDPVIVTKAGIRTGQSFYYDREDNLWRDAAKDRSPFCFRIKAIAEDAVCIHQYEETSRVDPEKGIDGYAIEKCKSCAHRVKTVLPALKPVPDNTKITKLVPAKKAMTVKWRKSNEKIVGKNIDGYQIRYSLKKSMKGAKTVTVKGWTVTSKKIKKLRSKKKYYVQIRTYKKTDGKTYRSAWSRAKAVKTR